MEAIEIYIGSVRDAIQTFVHWFAMGSGYELWVLILITISTIITVSLFKGILNIFKKGI